MSYRHRDRGSRSRRISESYSLSVLVRRCVGTDPRLSVPYDLNRVNLGVSDC